MRDVARIAGVDISLISRIVNKDPNVAILPATRARIVAALDKTGYRPNMQARGLRIARTFMIGFMLPDLASPIYGPIIEGAIRRAEQVGYLIVLGGPTDPQGHEPSFEALLSERRVDGLLIASGGITDERLLALGPKGRPVVFVNRRIAGHIGSVVVDDAGAATVATEHLIRLGHRRLAHLGGPTGVDTAVRRREGFLAATSRAGIRSPRVEASTFDAAGGYDATRHLLEADPSITGLVAANANQAIGAARAAREIGWRLPDDLSIVAIHDHPLAPYFEPPLTTVRVPLVELGSAAVESLLRRLTGEAPDDVTVTGAIDLLERASTALPRHIGP